MPDERSVIVIGSGPAGFTAAIYLARANLKPLVYAGLEWGGQLQTTTDVENYPGFPDGIQGPELMELFRKQAERFGAEVSSQNVTRVEFSRRPFFVWAGDEVRQAHAVIVATGAVYRRLGIPGETEYAGRGVSYCATCDGFFFRDEDIVVVGGGDSAMEEALFLTRFGRSVTIVHRRDELRASKIMQQRAFDNPKISFVWNTVVTEARGEGGKLTELVLRDVKSGKETMRRAGALFVAIGHDPATEIFRGQLDMDEAGHILVHDGTRTSVEGVFAAGDCVDRTYRQAVTAAGMGCMAAIDCERWLESHSHG